MLLLSLSLPLSPPSSFLTPSLPPISLFVPPPSLSLSLPLPFHPFPPSHSPSPLPLPPSPLPLQFVRCSVTGVSLPMFILAVMGNITYSLGIFLYSVDGNFLIAKLPWLVGSLGTLCFDFTVSHYCHTIIYCILVYTCRRWMVRVGQHRSHTFPKSVFLWQWAINPESVFTKVWSKYGGPQNMTKIR